MNTASIIRDSKIQYLNKCIDVELYKGHRGLDPSAFCVYLVALKVRKAIESSKNKHIFVIKEKILRLDSGLP